MNRIDGKATAAKIKEEIAQEVELIVAGGGKRPHLAAVLVGHDGGSETYVKNKVLACEACGFKSTLIRYEDDITEEELLNCVEKLNNDNDIDGFIVQLPLPKHIDEQKIIEAIDYRKDVDGFHPINVGRMAIGLPCFISATPLGIITLLKRYGIETSGKKCVILGRSNIVGKPMAQLMMQKQYGDATVTVCPKARMPCGRHYHCSYRTTRLRYCRHGETWRRNCRRRHNTCPRRFKKKRFPPKRRREIRRGLTTLLIYHTSTGWCRTNDHMLAHEEHTGSGKKGVL